MIHGKTTPIRRRDGAQAGGRTLGQWLDRWLAEYKADTVRPGTLSGYRSYVECYIKPQLGHKQVSLVSTQDIQRMYRRLKKEGRVKEHPELGSQLADSTIRRIHTMLHLAMKDAERAYHRQEPHGGSLRPQAER